MFELSYERNEARQTSFQYITFIRLMKLLTYELCVRSVRRIVRMYACDISRPTNAMPATNGRKRPNKIGLLLFPNTSFCLGIFFSLALSYNHHSLAMCHWRTQINGYYSCSSNVLCQHLFWAAIDVHTHRTMANGTPMYILYIA